MKQSNVICILDGGKRITRFDYLVDVHRKRQHMNRMIEYRNKLESINKVKKSTKQTKAVSNE